MRTRRTATRAISASEIARNVKHFEMWTILQGCEHVAFSDFPEAFRADVQSVFNVRGKLPACLVDKKSKTSKRLKFISPPLWRFLKAAYDEAPGLFSSTFPDKMPEMLFAELSNVFAAWMELGRMRRAKDKWSESDYAAHVYNILRVIAIRDSACRTQCSIQLPLAPSQSLPPSSQRVLHARTVIPDGAVFIRSGPIAHLSIPKDSPYKRLKAHPSIRASCAYAFCFQATPCAALPGAGPAAGSGNKPGRAGGGGGRGGGLRLSDVGAASFGTAPGAGDGAGDDAEGFEFASAFWEDKKSACGGGGASNGGSLSHAYRQNRMACAAALRHLHAMRVKAPVFGFVFADGRVRAHANWWWCEEGSRQGEVAIYSAAYPGPAALALPSLSTPNTAGTGTGTGTSTSTRTEPASAWQDTYVHTSPHEWTLDQPASILSLFLTLRNLDQWTERIFVQRVEQGVRELVRDVCGERSGTAAAAAAAAGGGGGGGKYVPWRAGDMDDEDVAAAPPVTSGTTRTTRTRLTAARLTATVVAPIPALSLGGIAEHENDNSDAGGDAPAKPQSRLQAEVEAEAEAEGEAEEAEDEDPDLDAEADADTDAETEAEAEADDLLLLPAASDPAAPTPRPAGGHHPNTVPTPAAPSRAKGITNMALLNSPGTPSPKARLRPRRNAVQTSSSRQAENTVVATATAASGGARQTRLAGGASRGA